MKCIEFLGGKCESCGYNKCAAALAFHHRDPKKKSFGFGKIRWKSWTELKKELKKCLLLCHNCHAETHSLKYA